MRLHWPPTRPDGVEWWMANFEELPGCVVQGGSMAEAEARLWQILPGYLRQLRRRGLKPPPVVTAPPATIEGITVGLVPGAATAGAADAGSTQLIGAPGESRSVASRADVTLLGS